MPAEHPEKFGPEEFARTANVSRETLARLKAYIALLEDWNVRHNLVARGAMGDVWRRHVWDSAQLVEFIPAAASTLVDLGSGAGFPGLVLAVLCPQLQVTLFESIGKKAQFLRAAAERMGIAVDVRLARIEEVARQRADVVTARACAPLTKLLGYAQQFTGPGTICLFLKGQNVEAELTEARKSWRMSLSRHPSRTDPAGTILEIRELVHDRTA